MSTVSNGQNTYEHSTSRRLNFDSTGDVRRSPITSIPGSRPNVPDLENALKRISDCSLSETYHRQPDRENSLKRISDCSLSESDQRMI